MTSREATPASIATTPERPAVLIYRREFLPLSETFIADHIQGLKTWRAVPACDRLSLNSLLTESLNPSVIYTAKERRLARWKMQFLGRNAVLDAIIDQNEVRLIHAHFLTDAARIVAYARRRRLPLVVTAHGYDATLFLKEQLRRGDFRFLQLIKPLLRRYVSRFICVSEFIRNELLNRGYPHDRLTVCRLGIDREQFSPPSEMTNRRGVLFVGRLVAKKGLIHLLRAWSDLAESVKESSLTIIGDGPLRGELEREAKRNGVPATFLGPQPREVVLDHMRRSEVFVMPSSRAATGDSEGMPIVAMEAQALATPVVVFDDGPGSEVIAPGRSGLRVKNLDEKALAGALTSLLVNPIFARELGRNGPTVVAERFDLSSNISLLERLYNDVVVAK